MEFSVQLEKNRSEEEKSTKLQVTKLKPCEPEFKLNVTLQKHVPPYPQVRLSSISEKRIEGVTTKVYPTSSKVSPQIRCSMSSETKTEEIVKPNPFRTAKEQLVSKC